MHLLTLPMLLLFSQVVHSTFICPDPNVAVGMCLRDLSPAELKAEHENATVAFMIPAILVTGTTNHFTCQKDGKHLTIITAPSEKIYCCPYNPVADGHSAFAAKKEDINQCSPRDH